jgi:hypothetical protein
MPLKTAATLVAAEPIARYAVAGLGARIVPVTKSPLPPAVASV